MIGAEPPLLLTKDVLQEDRPALISYAAGIRFFQNRQFRDALINFQTAEAANSPIIISAAGAALTRTRRSLALPTWLREPVLYLSRQPQSLQFLLVALVMGVTILCFGIWLRRWPVKLGCDIGEIRVTPGVT